MADTKSKVLKSSTVLLLALAISSIVLMGCGKKESDASAAPNTSVIFVKGDPENLIRGASLNSSSPFSDKNMMEFQAYSVMQLNEFVEKTEYQLDDAVTDKAELERRNETSNGADSSGQQSVTLNVKVTRGASGEWHWLLLSEAYDVTLKSNAKGELQPVSYVYKGKAYPLKTLHWSMTPDQRFISVLMRSESAATGRRLIALYFETSTKPLKIGTTDSKYIYLNGKGVKVPWKNLPENTLNISFCGSAINAKNYEGLVEGWNEALAGRIQLIATKKEKFAPFSDMNEHCVHLVDSYISEPDPAVATYGSTLYVQSMVKGEIVDSDVFMFVKEFDKAENDYRQKGQAETFIAYNMKEKFRKALVHELGHVLGLGHKYGGTPSLMSYDFFFEKPQAYDVEALSQLYPLK